MARDDDELETVAVWRSRLAVAEERRKKRRDKVIKKIESSMRGELRPSPKNWPEENYWVCSWKTHAAIRALLPSLFYTQPSFSVTPRRPVHTVKGRAMPKDVSWELARIKELALNHIWNESQGTKHARVAIVSSFIDIGILKAGYLPCFEDDDSRGEFAIDDAGNLVIDADGLPELAQGDYLRDDDGAIVMDGDLPALNPGKLLRETFFVDYFHYDNALYDPDGTNVFEASHRWFAEDWMRPVSDVRNDPRYDREVRESVTPTNSVGDRPGKDASAPYFDVAKQTSETSHAADEDAARVRGYDIYDFVNRRIITIPASAAARQNRDSKGRFVPIKGENDVILRDVAMPDEMEHGPCRFLRMNEEPGEWYPIPDGLGMAQNQLSYDLTESQQMEHRRNALPRWLESLTQGFGDIEGGDLEREKFLNGGPYTMSKIGNVAGIISAPVPQLDATHFGALSVHDKDFREAAGAPGEYSGVASADTATQASILAGQADVRNNDRRDNLVQTWLAEVGRLLLQTMQANLRGSIFIRVAGDDAVMVQELGLTENDFLEVDRDLLRGEFDVNVAIGSTSPKNSQARLRSLIEIATVLSQNPAIGFMPTFLKRLFEAADIQDENLMNEALQMAQASMQKAPPGQNPDPTQQLNTVVGNGAAGNQTMSTGSPVN